jgi:hypothetical protein
VSGPGDPFLLVRRPADLARFGLRWSGATIDTDGGAAVLVAGASATLTLTFPPQAIAEQSLPIDMPDARMAGPSRLTVALPSGARLPLTTGGVLAGLSGGVLIGAASAQDVAGTVLELPAGIFLTPAGNDATLVAALAPAVSDAGTTGLWQPALRQGDAGVPLRVLESRNIALAGPVSLTDDQRRQIVAAGVPVVAAVTLSALGATMDAELAGDAFRWSHRTSLGRDERVVVESKGLLYPFGHRARAISVSERAIADVPGAPAAIRTTNYVIVDEPIRRTPRDDFRFERVEILSRTLVYTEEVDAIRRPVPEIDLPEVAEQQSLDAELEQIGVRADELQRGLAAPLSNLTVILGDPDAADYEARGTQIEEISAELENLTGEEDPSGVARLRADLAALTKQQTQSWPRIKASIASFTAELRGLGARSKEIRQRYAVLQAQIAAIKDALARPPVVAFTPGAAGQKLPFDIRLATPRGDLSVRMPLLFVRDVTTIGDPHWPDFSSLTDRGIARTLHQQWTQSEAGLATLAGGVPFDLVQDAVIQPGDVHEVHSLLIEAVDAVDTFAPRLAEIGAKVAALRALIPDQDQLTTLVYNTAADALHAPLVPKLPVLVDFLAHADRSGGLIAPKFQADALSRTLGPAVRSVLDETQLPDFTAIYRDTKLLGLSLGDLIDAARAGVAVPGGPTIVPVLDGIRPIGVEAKWMNLPLKTAGIFRPRLAGEPPVPQPCDADLDVRIVGQDSSTSATIRNFALALPPEDTLVTLSFRSLKMIQAKGKPPAVEIEGFDFALSGALDLLRELQEEVLAYVADNNPGVVVRRTANGIAAGYGFALPEVAAGVFLMRNMRVSIDIDIPFDGNPVSITLGFARPDNPFVLAVTIFGGGGHFLITMGGDGVRSIDLLLQFGAFVSVSFAVATGEVHAYGAVRLKLIDGKAEFIATLRLGGKVDVLGLVSVAVELLLALEYDAGENILIGRATLVIEIHLLFFSRSVKLDSGEWILAGSRRPVGGRLAKSSADLPLPAPAAEAEWRNYWQAFAA